MPAPGGAPYSPVHFMVRKLLYFLPNNQLLSCVVFVGSGSLRAKFELSGGPSKPATLAVQFMSEGNTLSGIDVELVGTGYRLSLLKKRFATGKTLTCLYIQVNVIYSFVLSSKI